VRGTTSCAIFAYARGTSCGTYVQELQTALHAKAKAAPVAKLFIQNAHEVTKRLVKRK